VSGTPAQRTPDHSVILSGAQRAQPKDPDAPGLTTITESFLPINNRLPRRFSVGFHNPLKKRKGALAPKLLAYLTLTALVLFIFATQSIAQGCTQCLDSTRATPPAVQAAYRHAIILLASFAAAIFAGGTFLLCRTSKPASPGTGT